MRPALMPRQGTTLEHRYLPDPPAETSRGLTDSYETELGQQYPVLSIPSMTIPLCKLGEVSYTIIVL